MGTVVILGEMISGDPRVDPPRVLWKLSVKTERNYVLNPFAPKALM